ncbi:nucleopolyhedrovirus P10 family protein [Streptomyces sp. NPDC052682]|uniref:nucleopolyhedrovirus P10 family protein n=1 Tax=Streptomyces sp. NPDC052682 TaxID=3154954 RepID=UPI003448E573
MTTADRWTQTVRQRLGLGRLLPLGGPRDGAWIAERAAGAVLRSAARDVPGVRLDTLRIALADPEDVQEPAVPAPPSALPPGPLRVTAEFAATAAQPLPTAAALLRRALATAAAERLGLTVAEVDLRVTGLLDAEPEQAPAALQEPVRAALAGEAEEGRVATAVLTVPGVLHLTGTLGRPVRIDDRAQGPQAAALPHRHVLVELAVGADHRALDVAREARAAATESLPDHPTAAILISTVA